MRNNPKCLQSQDTSPIHPWKFKVEILNIFLVIV